MLAWIQELSDSPPKAQQRCARLLGAAGLPYVRDVVIPDEVGGYTQIDHLLLTAQGLVLLEWQYLRGVIHGSDFAQDWTRFERGERHEFVNPLRHVRKLADTLEQIIQGEKLGVPIHRHLLMSGPVSFAKAWPQSVLNEAGLHAWLAAQSSIIPQRYQSVWKVLLSRVACEPVVGLMNRE